MKILKHSWLLLALLGTKLYAQDTIRYTGKTISNVDYHDGQLSPAIGVHNIQTMRALRSDTGVASWTYNHAPMLAYWNNKFYLEYLSDPIGEHEPPGRTLLQTSVDGYQWSYPVVIFPPYKIPDGFSKPGIAEKANNTYAVMHQRMGFYTSKSKRLFVMAYYGIVLAAKDDPNDGDGVGRVIREVKADGSFGPIYFLRYNHSFNEKNTNYPFYKSSADKGVVAACDEILATPLLMMQTVEEADRDDPLVPLKMDIKAFNYYHLPDNKVVALWKYALTSTSIDEGRTWQYTPTRAPGFMNANAKIWGQKTSDGKYATVYNPSQFRWPLAVSVSNDGWNYHNMLLVNGEITSMRYGGTYKSYGPQYVRGIQEMDGKPADGNMWVTYSINKEDMWVSKIPLPIQSIAAKHASDDFNNLPNGKELNEWNIYSPLWCKVGIEDVAGKKALTLHDSDPFDYARAERVFPESKQVEFSMEISAGQQDHGNLEIELRNEKGKATLRIMLDSTGAVLTKQGYRNKQIGSYKKGEPIKLRVNLDVDAKFYTIYLNDDKANLNVCFQPVASVSRLVLRTGAVRHFPTADTPTDQDYDLPNAEKRDQDAVYHIQYLHTSAK